MRNRLRRNREQQARRGTTLVEFCVVSPVFFIFMFAAMEFAHLNTLRNTAHNAAYEAARAATVPGADKAMAETEARRILAAVGTRKFDIDVSDLNDSSSELTVTIDIPYADNAIMVPWFTGDVTIHSETTLKTERYNGIPGV